MEYLFIKLSWENESIFNTDYISISISPHQAIKDKDILVMLSYGDRVNLNQFEEDIVDILELLQNKNIKLIGKYIKIFLKIIIIL